MPGEKLWIIPNACINPGVFQAARQTRAAQPERISAGKSHPGRPGDRQAKALARAGFGEKEYAE